MEAVRQFIFTAVHEYPQAVFFTGLGLIVLGLLWILVLLFSMFRRAVWPMLLLVLGLIILIGPWILALNGWLRDTRPRERLVQRVDGVKTVVTLTGAKVNYAEYLKGRSDIDELHLANEDVTDETLNALKACPHLSKLDLSETKITDAGLATISTLPLKSLFLFHATEITDKGVKDHILPMKDLMELDLSKTKVDRKTADVWRKENKDRRLIFVP